MTIQGLINKIFKANQTPNNTVSWSGVNGLKSIQEDIVDTIRQRTFFTVPTTADLVNQGFNNAILCYVQDEAFYRWNATGTPNGTTIFPANDGGVWIQETIGQTSGTVTSVGLSMPAAFTVANSPITTSGVINVTGAGTSSQYIKGDGTLATFPSSLISGTGTTNYLPKWTSSTAIGNSLVYDDGTNVGVGTNSPSFKFDVLGTGRYTGSLLVDNQNLYVGTTSTNTSLSYGFQVLINSNTFGNTLTHCQAALLYTFANPQNSAYGSYPGETNGLSSNQSLAFVTNSLERMRITLSGEIGIGTTTPANKLDIAGTFRATSTTTLSSLSGVGTRMVVADTAGVLSTQSIPATGAKYYGGWQTNTTQVAAVNNTGYGVIFNIADVTPNGVSIQTDGSGNNTLIKMANAGVYNIQFSFQFQNTNNQLEDVSIWLRKNGQNTAADVSGSGGYVSVPNQHGGIPGHCIVAWNYFVEANANDYFQLVWSTTNAAQVTMQYYPAGNPPPSSASAILTVNQVN